VPGQAGLGLEQESSIHRREESERPGHCQGSYGVSDRTPTHKAARATSSSVSEASQGHLLQARFDPTTQGDDQVVATL
jgi:hypothetical protein